MSMADRATTWRKPVGGIQQSINSASGYTSPASSSHTSAASSRRGSYTGGGQPAAPAIPPAPPKPKPLLHFSPAEASQLLEARWAAAHKEQDGAGSANEAAASSGAAAAADGDAEQQPQQQGTPKEGAAAGSSDGSSRQPIDFLKELQAALERGKQGG